jgi:hypothetical protein
MIKRDCFWKLVFFLFTTHFCAYGSNMFLGLKINIWGCGKKHGCIIYIIYDQDVVVFFILAHS